MTGAPAEAAPQRQDDATGSGDKNAPHRLTQVGDMFKTKRLDTPLDKLTRAKGGKRSTTRTERKRGRYIKARPANDRPDDIAFDATFRQAAMQQVHRHRDDVAFAVERQDLQRKVRVRRASNLILFVVDASWSMAAAERNFTRNGFDPAQHEFVVADCFDVLERYHGEGRRFDLIVVDPPSFARSKAQLAPALAAYRRLNSLALKCLTPNGLLASSSCTSQVGPAAFRQMLAEAAAAAAYSMVAGARGGSFL